MTTSTFEHRKWNLNQVLEAARTLTQKEQQQLGSAIRDLSQVGLVPPNTSPKAKEHGRRLARQIRVELSSKQGTLDETMDSLRGRAWSS